jgi:hypothetical protein
MPALRKAGRSMPGLVSTARTRNAVVRVWTNEKQSRSIVAEVTEADEDNDRA